MRKAICETSLRFLVSTRRHLIGASNEFLRRVSVEIPEEEEGRRELDKEESLAYNHDSLNFRGVRIIIKWLELR